jgi:hypothetical protein
MAQDTGKFRTNTKDQYYTRASVAKSCVDSIATLCPESLEYQWIEPSSGNGAFLKVVPSSIQPLGIDLDPKGPNHLNILKGNFLSWEPSSQGKKVYFGNPPFGRQGSLAKAFIQHSASKGAEIIAFILPKSFSKPSMSRAFPPKFHCIHSKDLEKDAFEVNGEAYDVPCVFQIWQRKLEDRPKPEPVKESGFQYVKHDQPYHMAFRRVGGLAGRCYQQGTATFSPQSHYFIRLDDQYIKDLTKILDTVNKHVFPSNTVGPRSLSKGETNEVLVHILSELSGPP